MAIVLPVPLTIQEIRVLQEFRRVGNDTLTADAIRAVKHPVGGGEGPALSLVEKGFLTAENGSFTTTPKAKDFLAFDPKPEFESGGGDDEAPAE